MTSSTDVDADAPRHDVSFLDALELDGDVVCGDSDRDEHATDWGTDDADAVRPDAVVYPASTADVSAVVAAADERGVPVTPYAAGTGLEDGAVPTHAGISMDMTRMDAIHEIRPDDLQIDVGPGAIGAEVDEAVAAHGLFFPPLPSSGDISTIGGMIATDASGMRTVKYGEVADWVLELEVVLADGSVTTVGSKAAKSSAGYNLTELIVGSEGTLGIVTRATLELAGRPEQIRGGRAVFPTLDDATAAVSDAITAGVDVAKVELFDAETAMLANDYSDAALPERPMVFVEFHANHGIDEEIDFCRAVFEAHDVAAFEMAEGDRMDELWRARKDVTYAADAYDPEREMGQPGDVTVPIGSYPEMIRAVKDVANEHDLFVPCFGHAGDGNLHYFVLRDPDDPDELARAKAAYGELVERALELGGTATGEHGIGAGKRTYLEPEHGGAAVGAMRAIKEALDPNGTLNPGTVVPDE
jgi:D-lactate dehydrogenase (cytochrome)